MIDFDHGRAIELLRSRTNVVRMARRTLATGFSLVAAYTISCSVYERVAASMRQSRLEQSVNVLTEKGYTLLDTLRASSQGVAYRQGASALPALTPAPPTREAQPAAEERSQASVPQQSTDSCGEFVEDDRGAYYTRRNKCLVRAVFFAGSLEDLSQVLFHDRNRWVRDREYSENADINPDSLTYPCQFTFHLR